MVVWPRDAYLRYTQQFRQFHIDAKVDAMDRENKWYTGTIVHIDCLNATPTEVVVNFDLFPNPKYDELYPVNSNKLAPVYTHTEPVGREDGRHRRTPRRTSEDTALAPEGAVGLINLGK